MQYQVVVIGEYCIRCNVDKKNIGENFKIILDPLTPMLKASASELVFAAQKSATDAAGNDVIIRCSFQRYLQLTSFGHGLLLTAMTSPCSLLLCNTLH